MDLPPGRLEFLFDYLSPYAYLAWTQIHGLARKHEFKVDPVPVLLAGLLNATGQKGPAEVPAERAYIMKDLSRTAHLLGVPLATPPTHPFNPLLPLRLTAMARDPRTKAAIVTRIFELAWAEGRDVTDPAVLAKGLGEIGLEPKPWLEQAAHPDAKARLRASTDQAIADQVFGVPTVRVAGELFFGLESYANLAAYLAGEEDYDRDLVDRWMALKPSATRG